MKIEFLSTDFGKILKYKLSRKCVQWEPIFFFHADGETDGQTDMTKLIVAFRNSANVPKKDDGHIPDFLTYLHRFLKTCVIRSAFQLLCSVDTSLTVIHALLVPYRCPKN
jgi:hypothetical protein